MWAVGLIAFALKSKALLVWWFLAFPLVGLSADTLLSISPAYRVIPPLLAFAVPIGRRCGIFLGVPPTIVPLARAWARRACGAGDDSLIAGRVRDGFASRTAVGDTACEPRANRVRSGQLSDLASAWPFCLDRRPHHLSRLGCGA
jgi:hypothetical protein